MEIELRHVARAAIRWGWLIALCTVLAGGLAFLLTKGQLASYSATTTLIVNPQQVTSQADNTALQASRSQAETYVKLVESGPVLGRVIDELELELTRAELADKTSAVTVMNTQLIEITVKDPSPEEAARIANAIAQSFEGRVEELTTGRLQENLQQATSESEALRARQAEIEAELEGLDTDANRGDQEAQSQIETLREERTRAQETIADLDSVIRSINQQLATTTSPVEVADEARAAREPDSPKPMLMAALGLFLGFLVGSGLAAVLEVGDRKVRPETNIEELTGARLLAVVPMHRAAAKTGGPIVTAQPDAPASETIRLIRAHLETFVRAHPHAVLSLVNAGSSHDANDVFASLAVVAAESGISTTLIDSDLKSARLHTLFGVENVGGIANLVNGPSSEGEVGVDGISILPNLCFVSAGSGSEKSAAIIGSAGFRTAIGQFRERADLVMINTPPAVLSSDAISAAVLADGALVVGRYGETRKDDLAALVATVRDCGVEVVGVVMLRR